MRQSRLTPALTRPGGVPSTASLGLFDYETLARTRLPPGVYLDDTGGADDGLTACQP
jgi:hypothetical protein